MHATTRKPLAIEPTDKEWASAVAIVSLRYAHFIVKNLEVEAEENEGEPSTRDDAKDILQYVLDSAHIEDPDDLDTVDSLCYRLVCGHYGLTPVIETFDPTESVSNEPTAYQGATEFWSKQIEKLERTLAETKELKFAGRAKLLRKIESELEIAKENLPRNAQTGSRQ